MIQHLRPFAPALGFLLGFSTPLPAQEEQLLPTQALHEIYLQADVEGKNRKQIAPGIVARTQKTGLGRDEEFALGEVYYSAFQPQEARAVYEKFARGSDAFARQALQRMMWMEMAAMQKYDGIEAQIDAYRARFRPVKDDLRHLYFPVFGLADHYAKTDPEKAVKLVLDEIRSLPQDVPYYSLSLIVPLFEAFERTGRAAEALTLLKAARETYSKSPFVTNPPQKTAVAHRAGVIHMPEQGLMLDYPVPHDPFLARVSQRVNALIEKLEAGK